MRPFTKLRWTHASLDCVYFVEKKRREKGVLVENGRIELLRSRTCGDEAVYDVAVVELRGDYQRSSTLVVRPVKVDIITRRDQPGRVLVTLSHGGHQRRRSVQVAAV